MRDTNSSLRFSRLRWTSKVRQVSTQLSTHTNPSSILSRAAIPRATSSLLSPAETSYFTGRPRASALALQACFNLSLTRSTYLPNSVSHTCFAQPVAQHSFRIADRPQGPSKDQPVEATQHFRNLFPMFRDKLLHGVSVPPKIWPSCRTTTSYRERKRSEEHTSELQSRRDLVCR